MYSEEDSPIFGSRIDRQLFGIEYCRFVLENFARELDCRNLRRSLGPQVRTEAIYLAHMIVEIKEVARHQAVHVNSFDQMHEC